MEILLFPLLSAFVLALLLVPACRRVASSAGKVAIPASDRWHRRATPLFGGVAIVIATMVCVFGFSDVTSLAVPLSCAAIIFLVGLADDIRSFRPNTKLVVQIALASVLLFFGYRLDWTESLTLNSVLTVLWVVGITNAFNLLDNMDGLCAGISIVCTGTLIFAFSPIEATSATVTTGIVLAAVLGSVAGFLVYNFHPASIFMGDSGSMFIGFMLSALTLQPELSATASESLVSVVAVPVLLVLVPIFDTTLVTVSRLLSGRSAAVGGRDHSSHRLVAIGLSERKAVGVLWGLAILAGMVGIAVRTLNETWSALLVLLFFIGLVVFAVYLARIRIYDEDEVSASGTSGSTPLVSDLLHKVAAAEVLLDFGLVSIAYYAAYRFRFPDPAFSFNFPVFMQSLPVVVVSQMAVLAIGGGYRGVWRYFGLQDVLAFGRNVVVGTVLAQLLVLYLYRFESYSRAVFALYAILLFVLLTASRASFRMISEFAHRQRDSGNRLVIYGAGDGGAMAVGQLLKQSSPGYRMIGFIDDDPSKMRIRLHRYPVLGDCQHLIQLIGNGDVDTVVISTSSIDSQRERMISTLCAQNGVTLSYLRVHFDEIVGKSQGDSPLGYVRGSRSTD
tara:strand:+ start:989 stop:2839 length:1851 start_codon:yes stop_codon:yes gene_type:complete